MPPKPWEKYKVGTKSERANWVNASCQELDVVYHVAHLETAERILKDNCCRAGLIYDKSKLKSERILVNWLSPNTWANGSRYGNVAFQMDFKKLIENRDFYWVESIPYSPDACRILITENDHDHHLLKYDPRVGTGPWYYDEEEDTHYWNGTYTLEFMLEDDMSLSDFSAICFFDHHPNFCNISPETCAEKNLQGSIAGERFVAGIMANNLPVNVKHFRESKRGKYQPTQLLINAIDKITYRSVGRTMFKDGHILSDDDLAPVIIKAILQQIRNNDIAGCKLLISLFYDVTHFKAALVDAAVKKFRLSSGGRLLDDE
jgi:hypothetical protein